MVTITLWIRKAILVAKVIIDDSELGETLSTGALEKIARFFERLDAPYQMPPLMSEWLHEYMRQQQVDTFFQIPVGYSHNSLSLKFMFKSEMIIMEFFLPDGTRLMELRLHT